MTAAGDECSVGAVFEQPSEHVVYRDAYGVTVTTARIVSNSATYPLAAVTGVQCSEEPRPYGAAVGVGAVVFIGALIGCAVCELGQASFFVAGLVAGAVGRFVFGRPWRVEARRGDERRDWFVRGYGDAARLRDTLQAEFDAGLDPRPDARR